MVDEVTLNCSQDSECNSKLFRQGPLDWKSKASLPLTPQQLNPLAWCFESALRNPSLQPSLTLMTTSLL